MGPEPIMRIDFMEVSFGIVLLCMFTDHSSWFMAIIAFYYEQ